jgi:hypothetical protein
MCYRLLAGMADPDFRESFKIIRAYCEKLND